MVKTKFKKQILVGKLKMVKVEIIQFAPKFKDIQSNFDYIITKVISSNADVVIFPEMAVSGYFFTEGEELKKYSLSSEYFLEGELQNISSNLNKVIIFGFPEIEKVNDLENIFNSAIIISPNRNETTIYRKAHLFYKENFVFDKPNRDNIFKFSNKEKFKLYSERVNESRSLFQPINISQFDLRIGLLICYDWRFPEFAKEYALNGADLIVYPSNLVTKVWENSFPARALDNRVYVAVANRIGSEQNNSNQQNNETLEFTGKSSFYDFNGNTLLKLSSDDEDSGLVEIEQNLSRNKDINSINNIFRDFREDLII